MLIGGIHTLTLLDYPKKSACILFTVGCNFRCGYCHNPQFVLPEQIKTYKAKNLIPEEKFFNFLKTRKNLLDGVVISGGEPTLQPDLIQFCKKIKDEGFLVKLDTNGTAPKTIQELIDKNLVDYIAMDIKASPEKYEQICDTKIKLEDIKKSKDIIQKAGSTNKLDYEFRTTVIKEYHDEKEIEQIGKFCKDAKTLTLQNFRNKKVLNPKFKTHTGVSKDDLEKFKKILKKYVKKVEIL